MRILVTGANGLIGKAVASALEDMSKHVVRVVRTSSTPLEIPVGELNEKTSWEGVLNLNIDTVVHLAGKVPQSRESENTYCKQLHRINTLGAIHLARQCALYRVKRFIFVSTIKVLGEGKGRPYRSNDPALPAGAYAISKHEAEIGLRQIAAETGMEVVVIRPPLVYGPGVKANFAAMLHWLKNGVPLPLGAVTGNRRSLVALDNLVDLIVTCIEHPAAANQTFLVSDGEDLSTADLLRRLGVAIGKPARLLPVPLAWLRLGARLLGKADMAQRLLENLQVDISPTCQTLGWKPPISVDEGLRRAVQGLKQ